MSRLSLLPEHCAEKIVSLNLIVNIHHLLPHQKPGFVILYKHNIPCLFKSTSFCVVQIHAVQVPCIPQLPPVPLFHSRRIKKGKSCPGTLPLVTFNPASAISCLRESQKLFKNRTKVSNLLNNNKTCLDFISCLFFLHLAIFAFSFMHRLCNVSILPYNLFIQWKCFMEVFVSMSLNYMYTILLFYKCLLINAENRWQEKDDMYEEWFSGANKLYKVFLLLILFLYCICY